MNSAKILIVEDEKDLADAVSFRLKASGYAVISASDGQEGFDKAKKENPDLIILDLMLPKMDGYKICGLLKKDVRFAKIPVIVFTAKAQQEDIQLGEELGADAYIIKPFDAQVLIAKIEELLKKSA